MYTQCPECSTAFRVTADVLKQAAGKVRCGGCGNAFNALEYLSEAMPEQATADEPGAAAAAVGGGGTEHATRSREASPAVLRPIRNRRRRRPAPRIRSSSSSSSSSCRRLRRGATRSATRKRPAAGRFRRRRGQADAQRHYIPLLAADIHRGDDDSFSPAAAGELQGLARTACIYWYFFHYRKRRICR